MCNNSFDLHHHKKRQLNFIWILGTACKCDLRGTQLQEIKTNYNTIQYKKYCFMKQLPCKNAKGQLYTKNDLKGPSEGSLYSYCELNNDPKDPLVNCPVYNRSGNSINLILEFNINQFSSDDD